MELREYQQDLVNKIKLELCRGHKSVLAVLGCGGGKSVIQGSIAKSATDKGSKVLFLVHRRELCQQIADTFVKCGVDFNLCYIEMVQTVSRRLGKSSWKPDIIITDECHHALSKTYMKIYEYYSGAIRLGFTATPVRLGSGGLGEAFSAMVEGVSTDWLIKNHYLSPYKYYSAKVVDTKGLRIRGGEFMQMDVQELMQQKYIYGEAVKTWHRLAEGKKTIVYCASIESSKETVTQFKNDGVAAAHLDGTTPALERRNVIQAFRDGVVTVLSNVDLFGEGFDVPDCECVVLLRPTMSLTLHIQQSMRSMRFKEGKTAIIIDHVGNVYTHGLPDELREWSLEAKKKKKAAEVLVKQCPVCFAVVKNTVKECSYCGYKFAQTAEREEKETVDAELEEITADDLKNRPYNDYRNCSSFDELKRFGKAKGYKFLWVLRKCIEMGITYPGKYEYMVRRFIG